ncbi:isochorismatase family protein [Streptodolium elevatio]|uniref:Isochorismatase family protein n=1 Tax=Streptodolium elevatio TaxID=3157996 RepID=A0ABV3DNN7_9ACTN
MPEKKVVNAYNDRLEQLRTAVYRLYDAEGGLLYVGMTANPEQRFDEHSRYKFWWHLIAKTDLRWFDSRSEAAAVEAEAIRSEQPIYDGTGRIKDWTNAKSQRPEDPFWRPLAELLTTQIENGSPPAGTRLPTPRALAREHNVSIASVGTALSWLTYERRAIRRDRTVLPLHSRCADGLAQSQESPVDAGKAVGLNPRSTALLVIDVQQGFVNERSSGALPGIVRLLQGWREVGAPVVFSRFHNAEGSPYETITGWTRLRSAEEQALAEDLVPFVADAAAVVDKSQSTIFTPEFAALARESGWTDLVLCGIDTDACVYDSAISAYHSGHRPWIVTDACASSGGERYHDAALLLAGRNIGRGQLLSSDDVLARIAEGAPA